MSHDPINPVPPVTHTGPLTPSISLCTDFSAVFPSWLFCFANLHFMLTLYKIQHLIFCHFSGQWILDAIVYRKPLFLTN